MQNADPLATSDASWNPDTDPIYQAMQNDPTWQLDPDQLQLLANMDLDDQPALQSQPHMPSQQLTSPLTSPPTSPGLPPTQDTLITSSVKSRDPPAPPVAGSSTHQHLPPPQPESISGVALIPRGKGQFKASTKQKKRVAKRT